MESVSSIAIVNSYKYIKNKHTNTQIDLNYELLEPLSVVINLAILSIMKEKTKIAVSNNKVKLMKPTAYQGLLRMSKGYNREHISYFFKPIVRFTELYPVNDDQDSEQYNKNLKIVINKAMCGLYKLKENYKPTSTVNHSIDLYISILKTHLTDNKMNHNICNTSSNDNLNLSTQTKINIENIFKNIWSKNEIILIGSLINISKNDSDCESNIFSIKNMLKMKQPTIDKIIFQTKNIF